MKCTSFFLILCVINSFQLASQNCDIPQILLEEYERDVKYLAHVRMEQLNSPDSSLVEIPQSWQDTIWEGLAAIYNSESSARDDIFDQFCIHQQGISNAIYIGLKPTAPWFQNWTNGIITTDDQFLDSLFSKHAIDSVRYGAPITNLFRLYIDEYLNLDALAEIIQMHEQVVYASKVIFYGDGANLKYDYINGDKFFDFTMAWGDCYSGCIHERTWFFKVDESCDVAFLGSVGNEDVPDELNCNFTTSISDPIHQQSIYISPNPFYGEITIHCEPGYSFTRYKILDLNGNLISAGTVDDHKVQDLQALSNGIYFLTLENSNNEISTQKIIKMH